MPDTAFTLQSETAAFSVGRTHAGEAVLSNGISGEAALTVCVPCYHDSARPLIATLTRMPDAARTTLLLFDDGSADDKMTRELARQVMAWPGPARLLTAKQNRGRSHARNRLVAMAETDWILFIDADMRPDNDTFLSRYLEAIRKSEAPALVAGGFTLWQVQPTQQTALHAAQSAASECLTAEARSRAPGRFVFTSNILVHKDVLKAVPFDDGFSGWGWEDVDWGLRVSERFDIKHIDNTTTHLGLDTTNDLLKKFGSSGANFARLVERHPEAAKSMRLFRMAQRVKRLPLGGFWKATSKLMARTTWMPMKARLMALKFYRAFCYSEHL
ncbi:MAG: glycosyltransferase family A protein [Henriciella sp.]|uniref:glycosyltransferase family 2 protein n=1 Tax=Henriciella sp. TaxID=1968823 RepID=UPI002637B146|nr:glycosyltransferase family A protein [Henriciella sp.]